ncbi:MAG: RNA-dependent DNA polymerase [Candidatus Taylorbacteria bacterium CG11_big_fil_rev_8_21_14_0_20_46_11]|uniref:RNA-dependent DNA polymerase n=1 Tax=Candidatus Taylorbacteria bacterium CG11_big_fil_rev_8_21_14_0_20_46_11 TaxID=1975025 RepID=A0A2H0KCV6_9BACT|nr:MAG: RNA-dependent DNA polymerase [Candidatus Taylorbacteria bacterium CG11_big_fil_rev_8_21_14_0_20_46_11]
MQNNTIVGGLGGIHSSLFERITSVENLFAAWREFIRGKAKKQDIAAFAADLEEHIFALHRELAEEGYRHGPYTHFVVRDPKWRDIHKATVRDRLLHHALVRVLTPLFEPQFIFDSYSSRKGKGVHAAVTRLREFAWQLSRNNTKTVWILKCDIRKFFDSVDHAVLFEQCKKRISDERVIQLLSDIIGSFSTPPLNLPLGEGERKKGIPLGNVTSQLFSNVYMHPFDEFVKRELRVKYYTRYADDFVLAAHTRQELESLIPRLRNSLSDPLSLVLHEDKVFLRKWHQGVDFLGYVLYPHYTVLRTKTKRRILSAFTRKVRGCRDGEITIEKIDQTSQSYLGILRHCKGVKIKKTLNGLYRSL